MRLDIDWDGSDWQGLSKIRKEYSERLGRDCCGLCRWIAWGSYSDSHGVCTRRSPLGDWPIVEFRSHCGDFERRVEE
jgi:hypothetical protein